MAYWAKNGRVYPYKETRAQYEERKKYEDGNDRNPIVSFFAIGFFIVICLAILGL